MKTLKNSGALKIISSAQITLSNIYDAYTVNLSHSSFNIACNDTGEALAGEIGIDGKAISTTSVMMGTTKLIAVASNPTTGQYSISIVTQLECTAAKNGNDKIYINTLTSSVSGKITIDFNIEGSTIITKDITFIKQINETQNFIDGKFSFGTSYWTNNQNGTGTVNSNVKVIKSNNAIHETNLLEITNTTWMYNKKAIDIESNKIYRCRFRAKQSIDNTTGGKIAYFGYTPYDISGKAIGTNGAGNMYFKNANLATDTWTEWEYYISTQAKAEVSVFVDGVKKVITPAILAFPTNAVKFRPMFIVNYSGGNGIALVDGWLLEDATEQLAISDLKHQTSQIKTEVGSIDANVTTIKTYTEMSTNPITLVAKANYSAYSVANEGEVYLHGLNDKRNPADVDGKCLWNEKVVPLPKVMFNPNNTVPDNKPIYMVRNISDNKWWSVWKETSNSTTVWKRAFADVDVDKTIYTHTWIEANDIVVGYYIIKKTNPRNAEAPILTAQLFDGALNYKQATSMTLVGSISQLEILENELSLKVQKNNVISSINLYAQEGENGITSGIKIRGDKIDLQGQVTFSSLADSNVSGSIKNIFTQQNNQTVIDGGMIKTQTIKGNDLLLKGNMSITDNSNNKTFEITSNGDINIRAKTLSIGGSNVATNSDINNAVNNIQIGGRNLILNSKQILLNGSDNGNSNCSVIEKDYVKIIPKNNGNVYSLNIKTSIDRMQDKTYTLSFEILTSTIIGFYWYPSESYIKHDYITANSKWQKVSFTYTQTGLDKNINTLFGFKDLKAGKTYCYRNLKLEEGNKATDWTAAPEDIKNTIDETINNIGSSGVNIANNTNKGTAGWGWIMAAGNVTLSTVMDNGIKCCQMSRHNISSVGSNYIRYTDIGRNKYIPGKKYTVSFEIKSSVLTTFNCSFVEFNGSNAMTTTTERATVSVINKWTKLIFTFTMKDPLPSSTEQVLYLSGMNSDVGVTYVFKNLMIEEGVIASSWQPSYSDIDSAIDNKVDNTQQAIFNTLFKNGRQGIELVNDKIYISGEIIKANTISGDRIIAGTLDASKITTGIIQANKGNSSLNLNDGSMMLGSTNSKSYMQWTGSALNLRTSALHINDGNITIQNKSGVTVLSGDSNGNLTVTGNLKSKSGELWVGMDAGGITFKDDHKNEQLLRAATAFQINNRDQNGVSFALAKYGDYIRFSHVDKEDLTTGWSSNNKQYSFFDMWSADVTIGNTRYRKGMNIYSPIYLNNGLRLNYKNNVNYENYIGSTSWNSIEGLIGIYGDNGSCIGYQEGNNLMSRIIVTEAAMPGTGDNIKSWGNWNCSGYTVHNAVFSGRFVNSYSNLTTKTFVNTNCIEAEHKQVRVNFKDIQLQNGKAIVNIPKKYTYINTGYIIASIVKKSKGDVWISEELENRFVIEGTEDIKVNIEIIVYIEDNVSCALKGEEDQLCIDMATGQPEF